MLVLVVTRPMRKEVKRCRMNHACRASRTWTWSRLRNLTKKKKKREKKRNTFQKDREYLRTWIYLPIYRLIYRKKDKEWRTVASRFIETFPLSVVSIDNRSTGIRTTCLHRVTRLVSYSWYFFLSFRRIDPTLPIIGTELTFTLLVEG